MSLISPKLAVATVAQSEKASLTHRTARGFLWLTVEALSTKVVNFGAQILLARLLLPEHFGMIGLVYTVTIFADLAANAGLKEVLIQRSSRFARWANAATWMSLAMGMLGALATILIAPLAAWMYNSPNLPGLLLVMAISMPVVAVSIVPESRLRSQLRFRSVAGVGILRNTGISLLSVVFAWQGFEASSFVWPRLIIGAIVTFLLWWIAFGPAAASRRGLKRRSSVTSQDAIDSGVAGVSSTSLSANGTLGAMPPMTMWPLRWKPQLHRWRSLLPDTMTVFASRLLLTLIAQGGYIALGLWHTERTVGLYFFAYNLSLQAALLIGLNFAGVLFPALSTLQHDPQRQLAGFLRAGRVLAMVGVPAGFLQVVMAYPAVNILFGPQWLPAVLVLQILSIGTAAQVLWVSNRGYFQAQGRFATNLKLIGTYAVAFLISLILAAKFGNEVAVAIVTAMFYSIVTPIDTCLAIRRDGGRWRDVWGIYARPVAISILAMAPPGLIAYWLPEMPGRDWIRLAIIVVFSAVAYILLIRRASPAVWRDFVERVNAMRRRAG